MNRYLFLVIEFVLGFVLVFLYYRLIVLKKTEKFNKSKLPVEVSLFINKHSVDLKKVSYRKIMSDLSIYISLDIALILLITEVSSNLFVKLLIALPLIFILYLISISILGFIYKKKGLIKDVQS